MSGRPSRRTVLRGIGGALLALPALELMMPRRQARAQQVVIPARYLTCFGGSSLGTKWAEGDAVTTDRFVPTTVGPGYDLPLALAPLGAHGVAADVSVVSGLVLPWSTSSSPPPGHRAVNFHNFCYGPLVTGTANGGMAVVRGTSSEQLVGDAIGGGSLLPVMNYRVQGSTYGDNSPWKSTTSFLANPTGGVSMPVQPTVSPRAIWNQLFEGVALEGAGGEEDPEAARLRRRRLSALDLVKDARERLVAQAGLADRQRLEQHFDAISELEQRISQAGAEWSPGQGCALPGAPVDDFASAERYSGEEERAQVIVDLIHMALTCDISRAGSLMFTMPQSAMSVEPLTGEANTQHDVSHSPNAGPGDRVQAMARVLGWHVGHFARLVRKLAETPEVDGSRLLDHCALTLVFEGGRGFDPQTQSDNTVHSTENMAALIAGGAGGMVQGRHIAAAGLHPSAVLNTAMRAVGVTGGLGEIDDVVPGLLG